MPKASEIAAELRKVADHLDTAGEAELPRPSLSIYTWDKDRFAQAVHLVPRPFTKKFDDSYARLNHTTPALEVEVRADRNQVCRVIQPAQPAVYECDPVLSLEEVEAAIA